MSNKYCFRNLSISEKNLSSFKINVSFCLDEQQHIDLSELIFQIKSIHFDESYSYNRIHSLLTESIQLLSKFLATDIDVVFVTDHENFSQMISYSFPGCYQNQTIDLFINSSQFSPPDSVLIFAFDTSVAPRLLLVNHRNRGWELPGGKLELNETTIEAVIRETREEAATDLVFNSIQAIAQYYFFHDEEAKIHRRTVFVGIIGSVSDTLLCLDTLGKQIILPPKWTEEEIFNPDLNYSQYLKDNVYTICLQLAITTIMAAQ